MIADLPRKGKEKMKKKEFKKPTAKQLPSGSWFCRVRVDGKDIPITKPTQQEAEAAAMAVKYGIIDGKEKQSRKKTTLEQAVKAYIAEKEGFVSPATIRGYEGYLRNTFQTLMKKNIFAISDDSWQAAIKGEHRLGRSPKYIKNAWSLMASAVEHAGSKRPEVNLYPPEKNERAYLTPEEINTFVTAVKGTPFEIPSLLCLSSLRRSEMLALTWNNVDLKNKVLYVRGATVRGKDGMVTKKQNKSSKSRRAVPIIPPLLEAMEQVENKSGNVVNFKPDYVLNHVKKTCESAGITVVDLHGLRHSFASLAYHLGIPEMIAAEIGGWDDLGTMHNIYTHIAQSDIAKRSQDFQNYFQPKQDTDSNAESHCQSHCQNDM